MKKILLLTGICVLSACGGGGGSTPISGGATAGKPAEDRPSLNDHLISTDARKSNYEITSMLSQIFIPKNDEDGVLSSPSGARVATDVKISGKDYTAYNLEDIKFYVSDELPSDEMYVTFGVGENGAIDSLHMHDGDEDLTPERVGQTKRFNMMVYKYQIGDWMSDLFLAKVTDTEKLRKEIADQIEDLPAERQSEILRLFDENKGVWTDSEMHSEIQLFGKGIGKNGLRYTDFGFDVMTVGNGTDTDKTVIAGGYEVLNIPVAKIGNQKLQFYGKAVANAGYTDADGWQSSEFSTGNNATVLVFDNGKEKLTMPFANYYTVIVEKEGDNTNIKFTDWKGAEDSKLQFESKTATSDDAWIMYYGTNNTPTEAVGAIEHKEYSTYKPSFEAGFGVQITQ